MKRKRFTEEQITYALQQAGICMSWEYVRPEWFTIQWCIKVGSHCFSCR